MKTIKAYFSDSLNEFKKVVWPTKTELVRLSVAVIAITAAFTLFIGVFDFLFNTGYQQLLNL